jgi:hypothetical protein
MLDLVMSENSISLKAGRKHQTARTQQLLTFHLRPGTCNVVTGYSVGVTSVS